MRYAAGTQNMKSCIIYSSVTGNTRKVAEALAAASGAPCFPVREAPDPDDYDLLALGFWVRLGQADARAQGYMRRVLGKKVFFSEPWGPGRIRRMPGAARKARGPCWKRAAIRCWTASCAKAGSIRKFWKFRGKKAAIP